jgi:hypothetical protein
MAGSDEYLGSSTRPSAEDRRWLAHVEYSVAG